MDAMMKLTVLRPDGSKVIEHVYNLRTTPTLAVEVRGDGSCWVPGVDTRIMGPVRIEIEVVSLGDAE